MAMDASPLAKLPAELRNRVYHEVLCQEDPIVLIFERRHERQEMLKGRMDLPTLPRPSEDSGVASRGQLKDLERMSNRMAITATCKPLRQETRDLFFAINSFEIRVPLFEDAPLGDCKDTADELLECFLELLSTRSAISAVKSITFDLGFVLVWPEESRPLYDMVTGLNQEFLKRYPGLALQVKATCCFCSVYNGEREHVYIDLQNLTASIELALERLKNWLQEELEYRDCPDERETCQEEFDDMTDQLEACLQQIAATEEV